MTESASAQALRELTLRQSSGELICAAASAEAHVYLQRGRIAWATASTHPFAFVRFIKEQGGLDEETLRRLVRECRRSNMPFGETLVARGLATRELVKAALAHQTRLAVAALVQMKSAETLFIERKVFTEYDSRLTFELDELMPAHDSPAAAPAPSTGLASQLLTAVDGVSWVELLHGDVCVDAAPHALAEQRVPRELVHGTLADDTDFVAIRGALGSVIGVRLPAEGNSLWCTISAESTLGAALVTLAALDVVRPHRGVGRVASAAREPAWHVGERTSHDALALGAVTARAPEILAALILTSDFQPLVGSGAEGMALDACLDLFRRRARAFAAPLFRGDEASSQAEMNALGFRHRDLATGERDLWCFGAELYGDDDRTLWLVTDRSVPQGIGWACLATARRRLGYGSLAPARATG